MKRVFNHPYFFWVLLAIPSIPMMIAISQGQNPERLLHTTGEFAARFMIIAMLITPLLLLCRTMKWRTGWVHWLAKRRRALGVAAFAYALLHTILYLVDMGSLRYVLAEFWVLGIWTGWGAFFIFLPLAVTSNHASVQALGKKWKILQRWVYLAAILTLVHWVFVHNNIGSALAHFIPLALLEGFRITHWFNFRKQNVGTQSA